MKDKRHLILVFLIMLTGTFRVLSQEAEDVTISKVNIFIDSLKTKGISKIGFKKDYCVGCRSWTTVYADGKVDFKCNMYFTLYLFWQQRENGYVKKFDACGPSNEVAVNPKAVFEYPDRYADKMKKEELKPFSLLEVQPKGDSTYEYSYRDHGSVCDLVFINNNDSLFQEIDFYRLNKGSEGAPNQSYEGNKKLKIVEWEQILSDIFSKLEKEEKFKR